MPSHILCNAEMLNKHSSILSWAYRSNASSCVAIWKQWSRKNSPPHSHPNTHGIIYGGKTELDVYNRAERERQRFFSVCCCLSARFSSRHSRTLQCIAFCAGARLCHFSFIEDGSKKLKNVYMFTVMNVRVRVECAHRHNVWRFNKNLFAFLFLFFYFRPSFTSWVCDVDGSGSIAATAIVAAPFRFNANK